MWARRLAAFVSLAFAVWALPVQAQQPLPLTGYRISSWMEEDGLPAGAIWALAQDAEGFLWIGSDAGLIRFDGARFRTWQELGGDDLPGGAVRALTVAGDGTLWVGFSDQGAIAHIHGRQVSLFVPGKAFADAQITSLVEDRRGALWAGTSRGLLAFDGVAWSEAATWPEAGRPIVGLAIDGSGDLYVASEGALYKQTAPDRFVDVAPMPNVVQGFAAAGRGELWVTDRNVGYRLVGGAAGSLPGKGYRLLVDKRGTLWVATYGQGVWRHRRDSAGGDRVQAITDFQGLSNNVVSSLFEDRNGNIWVGTTAGLNRLAPQRVTPVPDLGGVTGVAATGEAVWVNSADGLRRLSLVNGEWVPQAVDAPRPPGEAMHADRRGRLWVGTEDGLERWSISGGRASRERLSAELRHVRSIASGLDDAVWILDTERGLHVWRDGRLAPSPLPTALGDRRVASIYVDHANQLWFALQTPASQLAVVGPGGSRLYGPADGYSAGFARMFFEDADGVMWVAGTLGLARFGNGQFSTLKRDEHLPIDSLTAIVQDSQQRLWLGTAAGIVRMTGGDFDAALAGRWDDVSVAYFDAADGVAGTSGWVGQPSAVRSFDGRLWFLTVTGMSVVDPMVLQDTTPTAPVRVDVVSLDDRRVPVREGLAIPPGVSRLQIEFTIPTLSPAQQTRFRYRLDGFDTGWINSGRLRTAIYTNLPPREYRFQVQLQEPDGRWREQPAEWTFAVEPAFYQTAWFTALCVLFAGALAWAAWRLRVTQMRRQLAIVHGERARLSREIHDTLLQSLVGVALQCDALANAPDHQTATTGLTALRRQVESYVRECRQSLWNLRSPLLDEKDLPASFQELGTRMTGSAGMQFELAVSGDPRRAPGRTDEQLLRIGQEAIANACRHSGAATVRATLEYGPSTVHLVVADDGRGFDPDDPMHAASGHWGLVGMQERARAANGSFAITSRVGGGTQITVTVPAQQTSSSEPDSAHHGALHGRSPDRPRGHRTDHQPAA